jgi:hypothetical protein
MEKQAKTEGKRQPLEPDLQAIRTCQRALSTLSPEDRRNVMLFLVRKAGLPLVFIDKDPA